MYLDSIILPLSSESRINSELQAGISTDLNTDRLNTNASSKYEAYAHEIPRIRELQSVRFTFNSALE